MFERGDLKKRVTLLDDPREVIGAALLTLGYSINTKNESEIKEAAQVVIKWKANIAKFENEQYKNGVASGEYHLVHGYICDLMQVKDENPKKFLEVVLPKEGTTFAVDMLVIPAKAKNPELAYAFINFVHEPKIAAQNTEWVMQIAPNTPSYALLSKKVYENKVLFPDPELEAKCELLEDVGEAINIYNHYWDMIKTKNVIE
jgi:spermidine/putrescine transport system substrate-binding protein